MGVTYDAAYAEYWKNTLVGVSLAFAILPTIAWCLRVWASILVSHRVRADDILMGCAVLLMWGDTASVLLKAYNGIGVPTDELPQHKQRLLDLGSWLIIKFWATSMACAKVSIILFLRHILGAERKLRITLNLMAVLVVCWAAVPFFYTIFFCTPVRYYWDRTIEGGHCVENSKYMLESILVGALALATDVIILIIPMPAIWHLQIRLKQKFAVTAILGVGVVVCVFSLLRCIQFAYFDTAHLSTSSNLESLWTILENDFTILCGCMPQLKPLFRRWLGDSQTGSSAAYNKKSSTYAGQPANSHARSHGFHRMGAGVITMVTGAREDDNDADAAAHGKGPYRSRGGGEADGRDSSEIELKGIHVHTTVNHEISELVGTARSTNSDLEEHSANGVV